MTNDVDKELFFLESRKNVGTDNESDVRIAFHE